MMSEGRCRAKYLILVLCFGFVSICQAIGFGDLKLYSYLGEPLYAEIEITGYEGVDANLLQVSLGSAKDFMRANLDRPYFLTNLVFQVITYEKKLLVVARTNKPVQIPYLEFLVELSWPGGNLVKEYTILLDPPPSDLSSESRSKGYAQKAEDESKQASEAVTPIQQQINMQKVKEQKAEVSATLAGVVKDGNKFSDQTFETPLKHQSVGEELVPGEVPEVLDEQEVYNEQRKEFETQQATKQNQAAPATLLQKTIADLEEYKTGDTHIDALVNTLSGEKPPAPATNPAPVAPPVSAPQPAVHAPAAPTPTATTTPGPSVEEPVDFNQVITPASGVAAKAPAAPSGVNAVSPPTTPAPEKSSNLLYLGIILSLLLVAVAIVIAIKRGLLRSIMAKRDQAASIDNEFAETEQQFGETAEVPFDENHDEQKLARAIEEFAATEEEAEQIELINVPQKTTPPPVPPVPTVTGSTVAEADLKELEEDFASINLDEFGVPQDTASTPPPETPPEVPPTTPQPPSTPQPETTPPAPEIPGKTTPEVPQTPEQPSKPGQSPTPEVTPPPTKPEVPSAPPEAPKPPPEISPPPPPEVPPSSPPEVPPPTIPGTTPTAESVVGPTMVGDSGSELKLSAEGASLITPAGGGGILDNQEAMRVKLELAKQYMETGDKESAKELLREVIEAANEEQKLVAQILLSTIV